METDGNRSQAGPIELAGEKTASGPEAHLERIQRILSRSRPLNGREWDKVRRHLGELIPGEWFQVMAVNRDRWLLPLVFHHGIDPASQRNLSQLFAYSSDLFMPLAVLNKLPCRLCDLFEIILCTEGGYKIYEQTKVFREIMAPAGVYYLLITPIFDKGELIGQIWLNRSRRRGEYTDHEVEVMSRLQPFLGRVMRTVRSLRSVNSSFQNWLSEFEARGLSPREREVALLVLQGNSNQAIAAELELSLYTVKDHLKNIFRKLGIKRRSQIFSIAL